MARNRYGVSARQWHRWGPVGQAAFNRTYRALREAGTTLLPDATLSAKQMKVVQWNAAFLSASATADLLRDCARSGQLV